MIDDQPSCLPSGFATDEKTFFSPGVACPSGYWSACSDSQGARTITTVTCCPVFDNTISLSCHNNPETLGTRWESLFCTWVAPQAGGSVTFTQSSLGPTGTEATTLTPPQGVNAYGIRMVYQSTDLATVGSSSSQTGSQSQTETSTAGSAVSTQPSADTDSDAASRKVIPGNSGLSTAATVAIAVVIPVLALLAALGFFLWWRSRRALAAAREPQLAFPVSEHQHEKEPPAAHVVAELPTEGPGVRIELPTTRIAAELPASPRRSD